MTLYELLVRSLHQADKEKYLFCGYTGNVDWVVGVKNDEFLNFQKKIGYIPPGFSDELYQPKLCTISDLINYVCYFLHTNSGGEGDLINTSIVQDVMNVLPGHYAIGGTGAQAANFLSHLDFRQVNLHLPIFTSYFKNVLHSGIKIYENNSFYENLFGSDIYSLSEIHCVFDFAQKTRYQLGDRIFQSSKADRIIMSHDRCNSVPHINNDFQQELGNPHQVSSLLIAGFNGIRKIDDLHCFVEDNRRVVDDYKRAHPSQSTVHIEEGDYWDQEKERRHMVSSRLYPIVDSLGMNQREYEKIMAFQDIKESDPLAGLYILARRFGLKRVNLHTSQTTLAVSRYPLEKEFLALTFAILLSGARAFFGQFVDQEKIEEFIEATKEISTQRFIDEPCKLDDDYYGISIPTLYGINILSTLGLGDAFTAGLVAYL